MQIEHAKFERIEYLRSRVAEMYRSGINSLELGSIALELLAIRNEVECKCEIPVENDSIFAKAVRDLEKTVVSLYMLSCLGERRAFGKENYFYQEFPLYKR